MVDLPGPEDPMRLTASELTASGELTASELTASGEVTASEQPFRTSFAPKDSGRHQRTGAIRLDGVACLG